MLGMAQLLERGDLEKAQRDHVKVVLEAGRGLKTLLDDIIALASRAMSLSNAARRRLRAGQAARTVARLAAAQRLGKAPAALRQRGARICRAWPPIRACCAGFF